MPEVMIRKTVPLTASEVAVVEQARVVGSAHREALMRIAGGDVGTSEAATLHALVTFALTALGEQIAMDDYKHLHAARTAEDEEYDQTMRRRVRDR